MRRVVGGVVGLAATLVGCGGGGQPTEPPKVPAAKPRAEWAIAIHGGAGVIPRTMPAEAAEARLAALRSALDLGAGLLAEGTASLDVVERVVRQLEDDPLFNAGKGAVFTADGRHELDAAIMDGRTLACGAVAGLTTVKNPISLARRVMEESGHVFLVGAGAEQFAGEAGVERVDPAYFSTEVRRQELAEELAKRAAKPNLAKPDLDTVGAVALDRAGNLAAATSTGGLTAKRWGRVGDVPVIGAGTYASNRSAAISGTGKGEQFIRHTVARDVAALIELRGMTAKAAAEEVIGRLDPGDGGVIVVGRDGEIALVWNSAGMYRGAADSAGRSEVAIWE